MFGDPQVARQLVEDRLDEARRYAADRRLAGFTRRRAGHGFARHAPLRMLGIRSLGRGAGPTPAPKPTTA